MVNLTNLRLVCRTALDLSYEKLKFICIKVTQDDPERDHKIPMSVTQDVEYRSKAESVFCDIVLLRSNAVMPLAYKEWADFMQRKWDQFVEGGCTFSPRATTAGSKERVWANFFHATNPHGTKYPDAGGRHHKVWIRLQVQMSPYCKKVVEVCKQKLRILAQDASAADQVFVFLLIPLFVCLFVFSFSSNTAFVDVINL